MDWVVVSDADAPEAKDAESWAIIFRLALAGLRKEKKLQIKQSSLGEDAILSLLLLLLMVCRTLGLICSAYILLTTVSVGGGVPSVNNIIRLLYLLFESKDRILFQGKWCELK